MTGIMLTRTARLPKLRQSNLKCLSDKGKAMGYNRNKTTNMEISKYVFHSIDDLNDGCCVLVGDLIITAGHVISDHALKIVVEGTSYHLSKDEALYYKWDKDNMNGYSSDIAVFKMPNLSSPIQLETSYPCEGMPLRV